MQDNQQLAHRDLKPSNILIFPNYDIKLADFGCSKRYTMSDYTKTRTLTGSPIYLSPQIVQHFEKTTYELRNGSKKYEWDFFKSDVVSLGLTLLSATTLKSVQGLNQNQKELQRRLMKLNGGKYGKILIYTMRKMLVWDENRRPSFSMIRAFINDHL